MDIIKDESVTYEQNGVFIHLSCPLYNIGFRDVLIPSEESWQKAESNVEQWIHVRKNESLKGHRFFVGYDLVFYGNGINRTEDIYIYYVLKYEGYHGWSRHIATFWADHETPYPFHVHMFDLCDSYVFNGLWEGVEGERSTYSSTSLESDLYCTD